MSRFLWFFGWITVALWSLLCLATYGFFDLVGRTLSRNADAFSTDPYTVEWLWSVLSTLHSFSVGAVVVAWAAVSLMILAVPWIFDRMLGPQMRRDVWPAYPVQAAPGPGGAIDLGPDQYRAHPLPAPGGSGPAPRIAPRR